MKVLILGCGSIGSRHARNLRKAGVDDLVVYDPDSERARALAGAIQGKAFSELGAAYREFPDAVVVASPTSLHLPQAREALRQGCHVLIEKPISHDMQGIEDFVIEGNSSNRVILIGYNLRFDPIVECVNRWIRSLTVGTVLSCRFHYGALLSTRHPWEDYRIGYGSRSDLGGGIILDASHEVDWVVSLFGLPEAVFCTGGKVSDMEIDVEDLAEILLQYPKQTVSIHLDYLQQPCHRYCEIIGSSGTVRADLAKRRADAFVAQEERWIGFTPDIGTDEVYEREIAHFLNCILGSEHPRIGLRAAADCLELCMAARTSLLFGFPLRRERTGFQFHNPDRGPTPANNAALVNEKS